MRPTRADTFGLVVCFLGMALLMCTVGAITLAALDKEIPDLVGQLAVASLAAIAGLLARTPTDPAPQQVEVINPPGAPVPVEPQ